MHDSALFSLLRGPFVIMIAKNKIKDYTWSAVIVRENTSFITKIPIRELRFIICCAKLDKNTKISFIHAWSCISQYSSIFSTIHYPCTIMQTRNIVSLNAFAVLHFWSRDVSHFFSLRFRFPTSHHFATIGCICPHCCSQAVATRCVASVSSVSGGHSIVVVSLLAKSDNLCHSDACAACSTCAWCVRFVAPVHY